MIIFNTLEVSKIHTLTRDSVTISFDVNDQIADDYQFEHGQFVQLQTVINGKTITRSYSLCSAPYERKLTIAVKRIEGGIFSNFANDVLKEGDKIDVSTPQGVFTNQLDSSQKKQYLLVAAGSGITPILSIVKMVLAAETMSQCVLIYGNKTPDSVMFADELEKLSAQYGDRFHVKSCFSQSQEGDFQGRITLDLVNELMPITEIDEFFVCGPKEVSVALFEGLRAQGLSSEKTHIELFEANADLSTDDDASQAKIAITIDGDTFAFDYIDSTRSILDAALEHDPDLPYGCQNGSCGSCQAKVVSGAVEMEVNYALSQSEVDDGRVLMCQSRPVTAKVEIDFDA